MTTHLLQSDREEDAFRPPDRAALLGKRVPVLDKGWVELQDLMGDDLAIVNASRFSARAKAARKIKGCCST